MSLFCSQCETINFNDASFCKNCGTKLNKEQNNSTNDNLSESERYFYSGNSHYDLKDYSSAIKNYTKAIELNLNFTNAYYNRGLVYNELKDYSSAIRDYTKAIELNPNYANAYYNRGLAYNNLKDYDSSIKDYTKAIDIDSNYVKAYNNRAISYSEQGNLASATEDARKACSLGDCKLLNFMATTGLIRDLNSNNTNVDKSNIYIVLAFSLLIMFIFLVLSTNGRANNEQVETYSEASNNINVIDNRNPSNIENNVSTNTEPNVTESTELNTNTEINEVVITRYGQITKGEWEEDGRAKLRLNGNEIKPEIKIAYSLMTVVHNNDAKPIQIQDKDILLIDTSLGGAGGSHKFIFFTISPLGVQVMPVGVGYDDCSKLMVDQDRIYFTQTIPKDGGGYETTEYSYKNGKVYESKVLTNKDQVIKNLNGINRDYSNENLKNKAHKIIMGTELVNDNDIIVKKNSKGNTIYCLKDMSVCKTEDEVNGVQNSNYNQNDSLKAKAYQLMTGRTLQNDSDIRVKTNSKGNTIYCLSDMSVCKTEDEINSL
jgi:hypothetical protein